MSFDSDLSRDRRRLLLDPEDPALAVKVEAMAARAATGFLDQLRGAGAAGGWSREVADALGRAAVGVLQRRLDMPTDDLMPGHMREEAVFPPHPIGSPLRWPTPPRRRRVLYRQFWSRADLDRKTRAGRMFVALSPDASESNIHLSGICPQRASLEVFAMHARVSPDLSAEEAERFFQSIVLDANVQNDSVSDAHGFSFETERLSVFHRVYRMPRFIIMTGEQLRLDYDLANDYSVPRPVRLGICLETMTDEVIS